MTTFGFNECRIRLQSQKKKTLRDCFSTVLLFLLFCTFTYAQDIEKKNSGTVLARIFIQFLSLSTFLAR